MRVHESLFKAYPELQKVLVKRIENAINNFSAVKYKKVFENEFEDWKMDFIEKYRSLAESNLEKKSSETSSLSDTEKLILGLIASNKYINSISLKLEENNVGIDLPEEFGKIAMIIEFGNSEIPAMPHLKKIIDRLGVVYVKLIELEKLAAEKRPRK